MKTKRMKTKRMKTTRMTSSDIFWGSHMLDTAGFDGVITQTWREKGTNFFCLEVIGWDNQDGKTWLLKKYQVKTAYCGNLVSHKEIMEKLRIESIGWEWTEIV